MADDPIEIDHEGTDEIVCPFCGAEQSDSWEIGGGRDGALGDYECDQCEKHFYAYRNVHVTYDSAKPCACGARAFGYLDNEALCRKCLLAAEASHGG